MAPHTGAPRNWPSGYSSNRTPGPAIGFVRGDRSGGAVGCSPVPSPWWQALGAAGRGAPVVVWAVRAGAARNGPGERSGTLDLPRAFGNDGVMPRRRTAGIVGGCVGVAAAVGVAGYRGLVSGAWFVDLGIGRRLRPLGPLTVSIDAPRDVVFDVLSAPYLGRQTRAMAEKVIVLERGEDLVLARHRTAVRGGLVAMTLETVRFHRPDRIEFRLVRGPVPHVVEEFRLTADGAGTRLAYEGELGTDLGVVGAWWGDAVAGRWEQAVARTFDAVTAEAERRHRTGAAGP